MATMAWLGKWLVRFVKVLVPPGLDLAGAKPLDLVAMGGRIALHPRVPANYVE
jgi:hypothetical protein